MGKIPLIRLEVELREWVRFDSGEKGLMVGISILVGGGVLRARWSVFMVRRGFEESLGKVGVGLLVRGCWIWYGLRPEWSGMGLWVSLVFGPDLSSLERQDGADVVLRMAIDGMVNFPDVDFELGFLGWVVVGMMGMVVQDIGLCSGLNWVQKIVGMAVQDIGVSSGLNRVLKEVNVLIDELVELVWGEHGISIDCGCVGWSEGRSFQTD